MGGGGGGEKSQLENNITVITFYFSVFHHQCWQTYSKMTTAPAVCCPLCRATPIKFPGVARLKSDVKILVDRFRCFKRNDFPPDGDTRKSLYL